MTPKEKRENSIEAWFRRLKIYLHTPTSPRFITRIGEIYEVDFGMNPGSEFSGRHLAICLRDSVPSQEKMLVIPLTTKFKAYNISKEDIISVKASNTTLKRIKAGVVLGEATWISKRRIFTCSKILNENPTELNKVKGFVNISEETLKRWIRL